MATQNQRTIQSLTVVQPDLCVIGDAAKPDYRDCFGAPGPIVEILSPGNSRNGMNDTVEIYPETGLLESPIEKTIQLRKLISSGNESRSGTSVGESG